MDSNFAAFAVIAFCWIVSGARINLCLLIMLYYVVFMLSELTPLQGIFSIDEADAMAIYSIQSSIDTLFIMLCVTLSGFYQKFVKLYLAYALIIGTSLLLNGLMMYVEMLDLSAIYNLHSARQELSIPMDVAFAVLGSAHGKEFAFGHRLRVASRSVYNRLNRFRNFI